MEIKPYPKNAKKHPDKQLKQIAASLKEFGWQQPIVVDKKGVIIVGHGSGKYKRTRDDWKHLCRWCHLKYDGNDIKSNGGRWGKEKKL